jgi:hypothetical protein
LVCLEFGEDIELEFGTREVEKRRKKQVCASNSLLEFEDALSPVVVCFGCTFANEKWPREFVHFLFCLFVFPLKPYQVFIRLIVVFSY